MIQFQEYAYQKYLREQLVFIVYPSRKPWKKITFNFDTCKQVNRAVFILILIGFEVMFNIAFAEDKIARLYTSREEKREAGVKHKISSWLVASGLTEFQWDWQRFSPDHIGGHDTFSSTSANVQGNFFITPLEWAKSEIIIEYDSDIDQLRIDEAEIAIEYNEWELAFGRLFLPFGNFISHFSNGPLIEFGETAANAVTLTYDSGSNMDLSVAAYRGKARKTGSDDRLDWSAAIEAWPTEDLSVGLSYLSDLAESDDRILASSGNRFSAKVPALSGYFLLVDENYEISLEALGALESFTELEDDRDQPWAFSLEFTHFLSPEFDWSFRLEGSQELEDEPELQLGIALNYRIFANVFMNVEVLHGYYKDSFAFSEDGDAYESVTTFGTLLSIGF